MDDPKGISPGTSLLELRKSAERSAIPYPRSSCPDGRPEGTHMEQSLILMAIVLVSVSTVLAERARFIYKEGSRADLVFEKLQLAGNVVAIGVELLLPAATGFLGRPLLAYSAATFHILAVIIFRVQLPAIRAVRPSTSARRSVGETELRRTRWPYQTAFAFGYALLLAYVASIFGMYF